MINSSLWSAEVVPDPSPPFVVTLCGDIRVLAVGAQRTKISQYHAGVEISGWYDFPIDVDGYCPLHRCKPRVVFKDGLVLSLGGTGPTRADRVQITSPPLGFVTPGLSNHDALAERIVRRLPVYWLTQTKAHTARCSKWIFARVASHPGDDRVGALSGGMRGEPIVIEGERTVPSFAFTYEPSDQQRGGTLTLVGLNFNKVNSRATATTETNGYSATTVYSFVGTTNNALRLLDGDWASNESLVAWHPDDEEHWFLSAEACTAAAQTASAELSAGAEAPSGGLHRDCFEEHQ